MVPFILTTSHYRNGRKHGTGRYIAGLSPAKLRGLKDAARYGGIIVRNAVVIDRHYF